jgi:ATP-dependent RNA helicase DDX23/PRP28
MLLQRRVPISCVSCKQEMLMMAHVQPKFLTKEERAKIAIAKRSAELKEQRERNEKSRMDREALEREALEVRQREQEKERVRYSSTADRRTIFSHSDSHCVDFVLCR